MTGNNVVNSVVGTIIGAAGEVSAMSEKLLLYTEATKHQLIGGGLVGVLAGVILASSVPLNLPWIIGTILTAILSIGVFDWIVYGDRMFPLIVPVLYFLGFAITFSLSILGTMILERVRGGKPTPANEQAGS